MSHPEAQQLSLFDESPLQPSSQEVIRDVSWSYSKRSTLERCSRQYYYEYFGANLLTAKQEPAKEILHFLKHGMTNRYLLSGSVFHKTVKAYFDYARKGDVWHVDRLVSFAQRIYGKTWEYSRAYPNIEVCPDDRYPPMLFQEYYFGDPNAEALCASQQTRLVDALRSFATDDTYQRLRIVGSAPGALVEQGLRLHDFPCKVTGRIDLAYRENDQIHIIDWKLGAADGRGDNSLQLAVYAIWAVDHYGCACDAVLVSQVHLSSGDLVDFEAGVRPLALARARVIQDAERMAALEEYGKQAIAEAFTRCDRPRVCNMCAFRGVCYA